MRAWARLLRVRPRYKDVHAFITQLHPVTLTRDTMVGAHTFANGKATLHQTILRAGTPVLVDNNGRPVTNCSCGNPLTKPTSAPRPIPTPVANCVNCPPHYQLPPQCPFWSHAYDFDGKIYHKRYEPMRYDNIFVEYASKSSFPFRSCYVANLHPPPMPLTIIDQYIVEPPRPAPAPAPTPSYTPPAQPAPREEPQPAPEEPPASLGEGAQPSGDCPEGERLCPP
jgi:hypothetical protein